MCATQTQLETQTGRLTDEAGRTVGRMDTLREEEAALTFRDDQDECVLLVAAGSNVCVVRELATH